MEMIYAVLVTSLGLAIFLLAMVNERRREFGSMRALGANLSHLRRFLFAEAATHGGLGLVIGAIVGMALTYLLVMLLGVVFTIPAHELAWPGLELLALAALVIVGLSLSAWVSALSARFSKPAFPLLMGASNVVVAVDSLVLNQLCQGSGFGFRVDTDAARAFPANNVTLP